MDVQGFTDQRSFPVPCNIDEQHTQLRRLASNYNSRNEKPEKLKYISKHFWWVIENHLSGCFCHNILRRWQGTTNDVYDLVCL